MSGPGLSIRAIDPRDDAELAALHATHLASQTHGRPHATPVMLEEMTARLRGRSVGERHQVYGGYLGDELVVGGFLELPLLDNTEQAWIGVDTRPERRRQGHGSAMLTHLLDAAREHGRSVVGAQAAYPFDGPADGSGHPDAEFLRRHGFEFSLGEVQRVLDLPVSTDLLDHLVTEAAPHHAGYSIRQVRGPMSEELIDSFGELIGQLVVEAPMGELEFEAEVYTRERIRADEEVFEASGRTKYTTLALAPDGRCVAYSDLVVADHDPGRVYQWGTLVSPEHRGHRLGMATKAHNLRWLQGERPDLRQVTTWNAEVNTHMIAVNERLGFRPVERTGEFQLKL